jgi:hypothetical protein
MPPLHWSRAWGRANWLQRLSGLTLPPSMLDQCADAFIASLPEIHASPIVSLVEASVPPTSDFSSIRSSASTMKAGLLVSSAKTSRGMQTDNSRPSSRLWKDWVAALRLEYSARAASEENTDESVSSSWPTVRTSDTNGPGTHGEGGPDLRTVASAWPTPTAENFEAKDLERLLARQARYAEKNGNNGFGLTLGNAAILWMTPNVPNGGRSVKHATFKGATAYHDGKKVQVGLEHQTSSWSTPRATDGEKGGPNMSFGAGGIPLPAQAANWATLTARMHKGGGQAVTRADGKSRLDMLDWQAEAWCQPSAQAHLIYDGWTSLTPIPFCDLPSDGSISGPLLAEISVYRQWSQRSGGAAGWRGIWTRRPRRSLNVRFAEYLMFWPVGWTRYDSAVTGFTRWRSDARGLLLTLCSRTPRQATLL